MFSATILVSEAIVVLLAAAVAIGLELAPSSSVWVAAGAIMALCVVAAGLVRNRAGYALGWAAQVVILAASFAVPTMVVIGVVFAALWVVGQRLGGRIDRERAERYRAELDHAASVGG